MHIQSVVICFLGIFHATHEKDEGLCQFSMNVTCFGEPFRTDKRLQSLCFDAITQVSSMYPTVINNILGDEAKLFKEKTKVDFDLKLTTDDMFESHDRSLDDPDIKTEGKEWNKCIEKSCNDGCDEATRDGCSRDYPACQELLGYCKDACKQLETSLLKFLSDNEMNKDANDELLSIINNLDQNTF